VSENYPRACRWLVAALLLAPGAAWVATVARADAKADRMGEIEMAFDQYIDAKTEDQRTAIVDFLQHFDRKQVAAALVDHIVGSQTGGEATIYNTLVEGLSPDGCEAVMDRLGKTNDAVAKGKLVVALRHCQGDAVVHALAGCLGDTREVPFEARGAHPRRVCDLAFDELYLKLRSDARYGFDPSAKMAGIISERTPVKERDARIAKLKGLLATASPSATPTVTVETSGTGGR
jgi:hypothetical protein